MPSAFEILKLLGCLVLGMAIMYLWVRSLQAQLAAEKKDRMEWSTRALTAVEKSATLAEALKDVLDGIKDELRTLQTKG